MKSKFAFVLDLVRANDGFPGLGFKRAAAEANAERTMMRFALKAYRDPDLAAAIDQGSIIDCRVLQVFQQLPPMAMSIVCRLETRLGRRLSRAQADRLVQAYFKVTGRQLSRPSRPALPAHAGKTMENRLRQFPMPHLPAFF